MNGHIPLSDLIRLAAAPDEASQTHRDHLAVCGECTQRLYSLTSLRDCDPPPTPVGQAFADLRSRLGDRHIRKNSRFILPASLTAGALAFACLVLFVVLPGISSRQEMLVTGILGFVGMESPRTSATVMEPGTRLSSRVKLTTARGALRIQSGERTLLLHPRTSLLILSDGRFQLVDGLLTARKTAGSRDRLIIRTGDLRLRVIGTFFTVESRNEKTTVRVRHGHIRASDGLFGWDILDGQRLVYSNSHLISLGTDQTDTDGFVSETLLLPSDVENGASDSLPRNLLPSGVSSFVKTSEYDCGSALDANPVVHHGLIYAGTVKGDFHCVSISGKPVWKTRLGGRISSQPVFHGNLVFVAAQDGTLNALDRLTGELKNFWKTGPLSYASPLISGTVLYYATADGRIGAISLKSFKPLWEKKTQEIFYCTPALLDKSALLIVSFSGQAYSCRLEDGGLKTLGKIPGRVTSAVPAVRERTWYVASENGSVYAMDSDSGRTIWSYRTSGPILTSPVLANDRLLVAAGDGKFYALDPMSGTLIGKSAISGRPFSPPVTLSGEIVLGHDNGIEVLNETGLNRVLGPFGKATFLTVSDDILASSDRQGTLTIYQIRTTEGTIQ